MSIGGFVERASEAVSEMRRSGTEKILLVHHDDADGLSSAATIKEAAEREGYAVRLLCLEKVYPEVIQSIHKKWDGIIIYADIGSAHGDLIAEFNRGRNLTIILDHHNPQTSEDPRVYDLNLENYGFKGEEDFSGATVCYLFSKILNEQNRDLSYLALVGSQEIPCGIKGLNKLVLEEALRDGVVKVEGKSVKIVKLGVTVKRLFSKLQILGPVGYYEGGPNAGVKACLEGLTEETERMIADLEARRKSANRRLIAKLYREGLKETAHIQWFDAKGLYRGMGSKVIGQFCSLLSYQKRLIKPDKYIIGIMDLQNVVPGWGRLEGSFAKVSARAPVKLRTLIKEGRAMSVVDLLVKGSEGFGLADGHEYAASAVIPAEKKETLIKGAEAALELFKAG